MSPGSEFWEM